MHTPESPSPRPPEAPGSLQTRLLLLVLGLVTAVWLAAAATTWWDVRHELDELLDSHLAQAAALLVVQQTGEPVHDDERTLDAPLLHKYAPRVAFQVFHESQLVLRSANAPVTPMVAAQRRFSSGYTTVEVNGRSWRVFAAAGAERDVLVYVGEQTASRTEILWALMRGMLWPMAVALPLLAVAAWWAVRRGLLPLRRLQQQLLQRPAQSLQPVALPQAPAELVPVVDALNGLLHRIGLLFEAERRFTADASHELRTPIAAIRAQAQVALAEPDAAQRQQALLATLQGCDRATRLVEQLLTLSRLEAGEKLASSPVDLAGLARQVAADIAMRSLAKDQQLALDAPAPAWVQGDAMLLQVLLRNLLDNAVRYSPPGARIDLSVQQQGAQVLLHLQDSGPGLTAAERARLGERFFRAGGQTESGSGLGWSIVQRIAQVLGLGLSLDPPGPAGGLGVRLVGPALHPAISPVHGATIGTASSAG